MAIKIHNPKELFQPYRSYSHGVEVADGVRLLFISGLNGYEVDWQHIGAILRSADMDYSDVVSLRTYLSSPDDDEENVQFRQKYMGDNKPSSTVICCQLLETKWKLEIEAVAAQSI